MHHLLRGNRWSFVEMKKKKEYSFLTLFRSVVKRSPRNLGRSSLPSKFSRLSAVAIPVRWICPNVWTLGFLENCPSERSLYASFERTWDDCGKISRLNIFPFDLLVASHTMYIFLRNTIFVDFEPTLRTRIEDLPRAEILQSNDTQHPVTGQKHRSDSTEFYLTRRITPIVFCRSYRRDYLSITFVSFSWQEADFDLQKRCTYRSTSNNHLLMPLSLKITL